MAKNKRIHQMTLSQCAQYDKNTGAKHKLTGWGIICHDRNKRGVSRKARILRKKESAQ
jgi:hypothetical protein